MIRSTVIALALLALAAPVALAQTSTSAPAPAPAAKPGDRVICKRLDVSGTRIQLPKKCMTKKDWDALDGRGKEDMAAAIRTGLARNAVGGG